MKIKNILISLLAFILGVILLVVCLSPKTSPAEITIKNFVKAIDNASISGLIKCIYGAERSDFENYNDGGKKFDKRSALMESSFHLSSISYDDIKSVKKVSLYSYTKLIQDDLESAIIGKLGKVVSYDVVIKVTYVDSDDKKQVDYFSDTFDLIQVGKSYQII